MSLAFDESGRPYIILREQAKKKRVKGLEAHKVGNIVTLFLNFILNIIDQYSRRCYCRKSFENIPWTKGYG
jgi:hypothetical protein